MRGHAQGGEVGEGRLGWRRAGVIVVAAALHALAFPPWEQAWLSWVALVPFLLALRGLSPWHGCAAGWLWGTAAIWVVAYWVPPALRFYYEQPWWFAIVFCVIGSQILWGTYYAAFGAAACWIGRRTSGLARVGLVSCAWVAAELARARLLTGEPWMLLGYGLVPDLRMIQIADLGGVHLISFVAFFVNATLAAVVAAAWTERPASVVALLARREVAVAAALVIAAWVYGGLRLGTEFSSAGESEVVVVQGNVPVGAQWRPEFDAQGLRRYLKMTRSALAERPADLIVWPESAVTFFLGEEPAYLAQIQSLLGETGAELVVGGPHVDDADPARPLYFNSGFHVTAAGLGDRYDKAHLLPFGEYFPLKTIEFLRRRFERVRTFAPGAGDTLLATPAGRAAVVICFEAIFPEKVRRQMASGAEILINLTNDVWLGDNAGPRQHASMVVLRAVENRTWVVRATTTGVSQVIDPHGRVAAASGTDEAATLRAQVGRLRISTVYGWGGDLFAYACVAVLGVFVSASLLSRPRRP